MTTPKDAIKEILATLDITVDTNWTDDGMPALEAIQKAANDETITRDQITDASPGFVRTVGDETGGEPAATETVAKSTRITKSQKQNVVDREFSDEKTREILDRRVREAEENLLAAQKAASVATQEVARCAVRLARAHSEHGSLFPPITPAQNIKAHLEAQIRQSRERAGLEPDIAPSARNQIDVTMERSNRRGTGQTRPTRPVNNVAA